MSENKTKPTDQSLLDYLNSIEPEKRRLEGLRLNEIYEEATGDKGVLWGNSIVGYGSYHYTYESGREGDAPRTGFSPRKSKLSIYIMGGHSRYEKEMSNLGKFKTGKSCVYVNKLEDINEEVLKKLIKVSYDYMGAKTWP